MTNEKLEQYIDALQFDLDSTTENMLRQVFYLGQRSMLEELRAKWPSEEAVIKAAKDTLGAVSEYHALQVSLWVAYKVFGGVDE